LFTIINIYIYYTTGSTRNQASDGDQERQTVPVYV